MAAQTEASLFQWPASPLPADRLPFAGVVSFNDLTCCGTSVLTSSVPKEALEDITEAY